MAVLSRHRLPTGLVGLCVVFFVTCFAVWCRVPCLFCVYVRVCSVFWHWVFWVFAVGAATWCSWRSPPFFYNGEYPCIDRKDSFLSSNILLKKSRSSTSRSRSFQIQCSNSLKSAFFHIFISKIFSCAFRVKTNGVYVFKVYTYTKENDYNLCGSQFFDSKIIFDQKRRNWYFFTFLLQMYAWNLVFRKFKVSIPHIHLNKW